MHTFAVLLLTAFLLLSPETVLAAGRANTYYQPTSMKVSPRTCDSEGKNCEIPVVVSASHQPGMKLRLQSGDTMYELHPVKATTALNSPTIRTCRPLVPSTAVTSIADDCFEGVDSTAAEAIQTSGIKQQGTYTLCNTDEYANICSTGAPLNTEQDCLYGLHTWEHTCSKNVECPNSNVQIVSYYCPDVKTYTVRSLKYGQTVYDFKVNTISLSNGGSTISSQKKSISAVGDQPNPYTGWAIIGEPISLKLKQYTARPKPVSDEGDCDDYCAMMSEGSFFHTQQKCYTPSADLCAPTRQVTWQQFDPSHNKGSVTLPYTAQDGSVLNEFGEYSTPNIVNPFTYTVNLRVDASPVDRAITSSCGTSPTAAGVDVQKQTYPRPDLLIVRRVCDQVVLSLGGCVVQYSHRDDSAMYWTVENRGSSSQCTIYVADGTAVLDTRIPVTPMAERSAAAKKLPAWAIAVITVAAVVVVVLIVIAVLCMCPSTRRALMAFFNCRPSEGSGYDYGRPSSEGSGYDYGRPSERSGYDLGSVMDVKLSHQSPSDDQLTSSYASMGSFGLDKAVNEAAKKAEDSIKAAKVAYEEASRLLTGGTDITFYNAKKQRRIADGQGRRAWQAEADFRNAPNAETASKLARETRFAVGSEVYVMITVFYAQRKATEYEERAQYAEIIAQKALYDARHAQAIALEDYTSALENATAIAEEALQIATDHVEAAAKTVQRASEIFAHNEGTIEIVRDEADILIAEACAVFMREFRD